MDVLEHPLGAVGMMFWVLADSAILMDLLAKFLMIMGGIIGGFKTS